MPRRSTRIAKKPRVNYATLSGKKTRKPTAKLSAPVRRAVTDIVRKQTETKYSFRALSSTSFNSSISSTADWYNCLPDVKVGLNPYERVGIKIQPTTLKMSWNIGFNPDITRNCDDLVVLYVFKMRKYKTYDAMIANGDTNVFLDQAQAGLTSFAGYSQQLITPVNKEQFVLVHKKIIHLQRGLGYLNNQTTFPASGTSGKTHQTVTYSMKMPKLIYDEDGAVSVTQPNNFGLVWAIGYAHSDMTVPDSLLQDIQVTQTSELYFKDS